MRSWSDLPKQLLILVFRKVRLIQDIYRLQMACKTWRLAYNNHKEEEEMLDGSWPKVPVLMLAEKEGGSDEREFFSLYTQKNWKSVSYLPEARQTKCMESLGWLITVELNLAGEQRVGGDMNLLHPFTRVQIPLPSLHEIEGYTTNPMFYHVKKAVLSASPSKTSNYIVVVAFSGWCSLGFWKNGDKKWTKIESKKYVSEITDIIFYKGKLYAATDNGCILVCDVLGPNPNGADIVFQDNRLMMIMFGDTHHYLVELSGELLIIIRGEAEVLTDNEDDEVDYYMNETFSVFKVDLINKSLKETRTLGGENAIFIGDNSSFSIEVNNFSGVLKPNCIYFTKDIKEELVKEIGIYHVEDGTIERFHNVQSFSYTISPPVWIRPSI